MPEGEVGNTTACYCGGTRTLMVLNGKRHWHCPRCCRHLCPVMAQRRSKARKTHSGGRRTGRLGGRGRPRKPRCPCEAYTVDLALKRGHVCSINNL